MTNNNSGKYLYCFIETRKDKQYAGFGVERSYPVYTIRYKDIAAIVSDSTKDVIKATAEDCLIHEKMIEEVMKECTVLPFEFGTVSPDKEAVITLLKDNYSNIKRSIKLLSDKLEMNVRAVWVNMNSLFNEIISENRDIALYKKEIKNKPVNKTYNDRINIGRLVAQALNVKKEKARDSIIKELERETVGCAPERMIGDNMILNEAFLVRKRNLPKFEARLYKLGEKFNNRIDFKYMGPLPPYNFTNLKLKVRG